MRGLFWSALIVAPIVVQACAALLDEWFFHRRRVLGTWERVGHPLDTLLVIIPLSLAVCCEFSERVFIFYSILALLSCLLVLKDEYIHHSCCGWQEQLLHAIMFQCHPLVFVSMGFAWAVRDHVLSVSSDLMAAGSISAGMVLVCILLGIHFFAQLPIWLVHRPGAVRR